MAKFFGKVGYRTDQAESSPGVLTNMTIEKDRFGDVLNETSRLDSGSQVNDNISISCRISFVAHSYDLNHAQDILYVVYAGAKWKVKSAEIQYPRIIVTLGEIYNG